jgi:multicomponent Na+:H+ antiporter subunit E
LLEIRLRFFYDRRPTVAPELFRALYQESDVGRGLLYGILLTFVLAVLWLLLSGMWWHGIITGFGVFSVIASIYMTNRFGLIDGETVPFRNLVALWAPTGLWLGGEIFKANIEVVKLALSPDLNIKPVMTHLGVSEGSDLARTTFANSITLTPGTVTVEVEEGGFLIHALDESFADQEAFIDMGKRATKAADGEAT